MLNNDLLFRRFPKIYGNEPKGPNVAAKGWLKCQFVESWRNQSDVATYFFYDRLTFYFTSRMN